MLSETEFAYIAGLIDGEGCISLEPPGQTRTGKFRAPRARLIVYMTHEGVLRWLQKHCGGTFYERKKRQPNQKRIYCWALSGANVGLLLTDLLPFLQVKREHAEVALEFLATERPAPWRLPLDYRERLCGLAERMHELNRRGPGPDDLIMEEGE